MPPSHVPPCNTGDTAENKIALSHRACLFLGIKVQRVSWKDPAETICFLWLSIQVCKGGGNELGTTDLEPSLTSARAKSKTLSNSTSSLHLRFLLKRKICGCSTRACISHIHCSWLRETNHLLHWHALVGKVSKKSIPKQVSPWYNNLYYNNTLPVKKWKKLWFFSRDLLFDNL